MIVYLSSVEVSPWVMELYDNPYKPYLLISYINSKMDLTNVFAKAEDVMVDSGAFTLRQQKKGNIDWDAYIDSYAEFVVNNNIKRFIELDIDNVVGYERVKEFRRTLEHKTQKRCIPVWHFTRGKEDFLRMCDEYDYVALGGLVGKKTAKRLSEYKKAFPWFINEAHKRGAKIHGLGITSMELLEKCHFDSVDSRSWNTSYIYGHGVKFDGRRLVNMQKPPGKQMKSYLDVGMAAFNEWVKFQKYALYNL